MQSKVRANDGIIYIIFVNSAESWNRVIKWIDLHPVVLWLSFTVYLPIDSRISRLENIDALELFPSFVFFSFLRRTTTTT